MGILQKVNIAFSGVLSRVFMYTGPVEKPTETHDITGVFNEILIGWFLRKPGLIAAPDGSEFLVTVTLTPADRAAKQLLIEQAMRETTAQNLLDMEMSRPAEGSDEWKAAQWALGLTGADKAFFQRIAAARAKGSRITFRTGRPDQLTVLIAAPAKRPKPKPEETAAVLAEMNPGESPVFYDPKDPDAYNATPLADAADEMGMVQAIAPAPQRVNLVWKADRSGVEAVPSATGLFFVANQPNSKEIKYESVDPRHVKILERADLEPVAVVVLTIPESNSNTFIVERTAWDTYATKGTEHLHNWEKAAKHYFCLDYNLSPDDITEIDYDQTRTRAELDALPDLNF